jgi:hypothetical protein
MQIGEKTTHPDTGGQAKKETKGRKKDRAGQSRAGLSGPGAP